MDTTNYGSVITEQGDLGLGVTPINEQKETKKEEKESERKEK